MDYNRQPIVTHSNSIILIYLCCNRYYKSMIINIIKQ